MSATKTRSVEQALFEAFSRYEGVRLSAEEVQDLVNLDDAIRTRITNEACAQIGIDELGADAVRNSRGETWAQFKRRLRKDNPQ